MNTRKAKARPIVTPRILVLEGLYADTSDIVDAAGGIGIEASPWDFKVVTDHLKSGRIDGILLTGGSDVNPARYGCDPHPRTQNPDNMRDFTELTALRHARKNRIPVLGICRGSQIMCVSQGGTLTQDIIDLLEPAHYHGSGDHMVWASNKGSTFRQACLGERIEVVSLHHQCVQNPGRGMRIAARSEGDGVPEAIESKDGLMLGVQFHPEMTAFGNPQSFGIFRWLVETAAMRKGGRAKAVSFLDASETYYESIANAYSAWKHDSDTDDKNSSTGYYDSDGWHAYTDCAAFEEGTSGKSSADPAGTPKREGKHRQAGDPAIPSMRETAPTEREMVSIIEREHGLSITEDTHGNWIMPDGSIVGRVVETPRPTDLELNLRTCPICHIRFDLIEDCDDHKKFVHPTGAEPLALLPPGPPVADNNDHNYNCDTELRKRIEERFAERFPELEPPPGHKDWEPVNRDDEQRIVDRMMRERAAVELGFDPEDWEDIDP